MPPDSLQPLARPFPWWEHGRTIVMRVLFYGDGVVQRLADFLREHLRSKWFLQEGNSFLKRPVLRDYVVSVAGHIQHSQIGVTPGEPLGQLASAHSRHHHVRYQQMDFGAVVSRQ